MNLIIPSYKYFNCKEMLIKQFANRSFCISQHRRTSSFAPEIIVPTASGVRLTLNSPY
jgi:hypothetical protein